MELELTAVQVCVGVLLSVIELDMFILKLQILTMDRKTNDNSSITMNLKQSGK